MKITIVSQLFYPEEFKINDLAEELVKRGHQVTVITGKPNYPSGEYAPGYKFWGVNHEDYNGAKVIRVPLIRRKRGGGVRLILNYFSFVLFGCWYTLTHRIPSDVVLCFEVSPITQAYPAIVVKKRTHSPLVMWVQDLWPESVSAASSIKNPKIISMLGRMVRGIYSRCDRLLIQSIGFRSSILQKGDYDNKIVYAPNWAEDLFLNSDVADPTKYGDIMPQGFRIMFAGNIGVAQDFDSIMRAAKLTADTPEIKWVIVGDGRYRKDVGNMVDEYGLHDTVIFMGRHPAVEMPHFFVHADAMLVTLRDEEIFALTIPSKIQAYMAFGKPILAMINGVAQDVISEAQCGLSANASDYQMLANNAKAMYRMSREQLHKWGENSRSYYQSHFDKHRVVDTIVDTMNDAISDNYGNKK